MPNKHLIASCLTFAALTVAPVPMASASPALTHPTGTIAPVGTVIKGTNLGNIVLTSAIGTLACSTATLTGTLAANSTIGGVSWTITTVDVSGTGETITGEPEPECTGVGFLVKGFGVTWTTPLCLEAVEQSDALKLRGGACTEKPKVVVFHQAFTERFGNCTYQRSSLSGTFVTDPEDAILTFTEQEFVDTSHECGLPNIKTSLAITLETDKTTAEGVYLSS